MSDNIKVVVKVRPLISREIDKKLPYQWRVNNNTLHQLDHSGASYTFDKVYDEKTETKDVYNDVAKPIVEAAISGINGTIFAYGQTSSGKTYTMTGTDDSPGIIPLAVLDLFDIIKSKDDRDFLLRVAYMEIYNEKIRDLLEPANNNIKIYDTYKGMGVKVEVSEKVTSCPEEVFDYMKQGQTNRQTGATNMNEASSRSHSIFQITIESRQHGDGEDGCVNVSTLNLVDLAGSERSGQTGATGKRFKEGTHINKSLSSLALVIKQLSEDPNKFANYRDSKLTRILQNSLGGNAKTSIICAVTPAAAEETISTLQFANRAKAIQNKPEVNEVATDATMIQKLTKKLTTLQSQLENKKSLEQDNQKLQEKIKTLQRQILNGFAGTISSVHCLADRRRTWAAPRRATIDTLHTIEESPDKAVQRFCTPALKYNPLMLSVPDFMPVANANKMPRVSEESTSGLITPPPPGERKVNFSDNDEIIDLDSDDDEKPETCSPYHKCYESSKTPPCILREKAKKAEKNYNEIVELTDRERMYKPDIVELMEKLEQNTNIVAQLEEKVNTLNITLQEKDSNIDSLKIKISQMDNDMETISSEKANIETRTAKQIESLNTQLTELEVTYETLKKKYKTREEDLLEQLNEMRLHQSHSLYGKSRSRTSDRDNFLDLSKEISLINSDAENSTVADEVSAPLYDLIDSLKSQISSKTELVLELEAKLHTQEKDILDVESSNEPLKLVIASLNEKLNLVENENTTLKASLEHLNSIIETLNESLVKTNSANDSYDGLVKDLQLRIKEQAKTCVVLDDSALEAMIANEEKFLASNENLKNIIHSLKNMVDVRNCEIMNLKAASSCDISSEITSKDTNNTGLLNDVGQLQQQLKEKENFIRKLVEENHSLQRRCEMHIDMQTPESRFEIINEESDFITGLLERKENEGKALNTKYENDSEETRALAKQVDSLNQQLNEVTEEKHSLTELKTVFEQELEKLRNKIEMTSQERDDATAEAHLLKSESYTIKTELSNYQLVQSEFTMKLEELQNEVDRLNEKISKMQSDIDEKEKLILSLRANQLSQEHTVIAITATDKILELISKITGKTHKAHETSTIEAMVKSLSYCADSLAETADMIEAERVQATQTNLKLLSVLESKAKITEDEEANRATNAKYLIEIEENANIINDLKLKLQATTSDVEKLQEAVECKNQALISTEQKVSDLAVEIENMSLLLQEKETLHLALKQHAILDASHLEAIKNGSSDEFVADLANSDNMACEIRLSFPDIYVELIRQRTILTESIAHRDIVLKNILEKLTSLINGIKVENKPGFEAGDNNIEKYKEIPDVVDKIAAHIRTMDSNLRERNGMLEKALDEANVNITNLKSMTAKVRSELYDYKENYLRAMVELDAINMDNKSLTSSLIECNEILETLKKEIAAKGYLLENIEKGTKQFKSKFTDLDKTTNQSIKKLETENDSLRKQLNILTERQDDAKNINKIPRKSLTATIQQAISVPRSLSSISVERVIELLAANDWRTDGSASESLHSLSEFSNKGFSELCEYNTYTVDTELNEIREDNAKLKELVELLKAANKKLLEEQEEIRKEVVLLLEPAVELQKKISNHRTNMSTLTATTYAENKALQSQVKVLQHHHRRLHTVIQKDLPSMKESLRELVGVIKMEAENNSNNSFKRFSLPDVLDKNNATSTTFRNNSTLDADLLMLNTNVTLTSVEGTLVGLEQDFDITQMDPETTYNSNLDLTVNYQKLGPGEIETLASENKNLYDLLRCLQRENKDLREKVEIASQKSTVLVNTATIAVNTSLNVSSSGESDKVDDCENCKDKAEIVSQLNLLRNELDRIVEQKLEIERKCRQLELEITSSETLVHKISVLENEKRNNLSEITSLTNALRKKSRELNQLQEEHDTLSTQLIESITEGDNLRKEIDDFAKTKADLKQKCLQLQNNLESSAQAALEPCPQCVTKKKTLRHIPETDTLLNKSQGDIDTSLRHSKICTLQNEVQASREDCKKITEEFATIKYQLERSNLSMNQTMDDSMGESNIFTFTKEFDSIDTQTTSKLATSMPNIMEENPIDIYTIDKSDCLTYFIEITGAQKENLHHDVKIIDLMKILYNNIMTAHGNEVDNLFNQLRNLRDSNVSLENQVSVITDEYAKIRRELDDKTTGITAVTKTLESINHSLNMIKDGLNNGTESDKNSKLVAVFKDSVLNALDREFTLSTTLVFESLIDSIATKHHADLSSIMEKYTRLQEYMENLTAELTTVNENLHDMKEQLTEREKEYNLLKAQKEKVYEISNAVTLDIIKKEQELSETITKGCRKLLDYNIIDPSEFDLSLPPKKNVGFLFEFLIQKHTTQEKSGTENEKEKLMLELANLRSDNDKNKEIYEKMRQDFVKKESELQTLQSLREEYEKIVSDKNNNASIIQKLKHEIEILEETVASKQTLMHDLESQINYHKSRNIDCQLNELVMKIEASESEISTLRFANEALIKEKEETSLTLAKANENIHAQKEKLEEMARKIHNLETSLNESMRRVETLQHESKSVLDENKALKERISTLESNNKTHEKSVEIQSGIIKRLKNQKEEETAKHSKLQVEFNALEDRFKQTNEELHSLQSVKESLEVRVKELESGLGEGYNPLSTDANNSNVRRRRQSIQDSKRNFGEVNSDDHSKAESIFMSRSKPDDLFMDCEDDSSNRSTPAKSAKRRDSSLTKTDQSAEEAGSRPSSVAATRIRRQSIHDLHRSVHTPSPRESLLGSQLKEELENMDTDAESEVANLKSTLAQCQQELEELKERYRELDEECETCAQYLHERDEQCFQLKKEKAALQNTIAELKDSLSKGSHNQSESTPKRSFANASVNTDEDWTNLHSVVVDRMSFDAEVEKNKRLTRAVEDCRLKNRELKATNAKMHKALDKFSERGRKAIENELKETRQQLAECRQELAELQERYKELDEECDTCALYLRERDEQILRLKEAKFALETKLQEAQDAGISQSTRKKRQSVHDQNRAPQPYLADASTETSDDFLSYQVERDSAQRAEGDGSRDSKRVSQTDEVSRQKSLSQGSNQPVYVATGSAIVQGQQITDIMKENQKLKRINAQLVRLCKKRDKSHQDENRKAASEQT